MGYEELDQKFHEIAQLLFKNYAIKKGEEIYRIREIEFYYHSSNYKDLRSGSNNETLTYQRTCQADRDKIVNKNKILYNPSKSAWDWVVGSETHDSVMLF